MSPLREVVAPLIVVLEQNQIALRQRFAARLVNGLYSLKRQHTGGDVHFAAAAVLVVFPFPYELGLECGKGMRVSRTVTHGGRCFFGAGIGHEQVISHYRKGGVKPALPSGRCPLKRIPDMLGCGKRHGKVLAGTREGTPGGTWTKPRGLRGACRTQIQALSGHRGGAETGFQILHPGEDGQGMRGEARGFARFRVNPFGGGRGCRGKPFRPGAWQAEEGRPEGSLDEHRFTQIGPPVGRPPVQICALCGSVKGSETSSRLRAKPIWLRASRRRR